MKAGSLPGLKKSMNENHAHSQTNGIGLHLRQQKLEKTWFDCKANLIVTCHDLLALITWKQLVPIFLEWHWQWVMIWTDKLLFCIDHHAIIKVTKWNGVPVVYASGRVHFYEIFAYRKIIRIFSFLKPMHKWRHCNEKFCLETFGLE